MDHLNKLLLSVVARRTCEIAPIAGKGRGLVALRNLTAGETVLADPPLALVHRGAPDGESAFRDLDRLYQSSQISKLALRCVHRIVEEAKLTGASSSTWERLRVLARPVDGSVPVQIKMTDLETLVPQVAHVLNESLLSQLVGILHLNVVGLEQPDASAIFAGASMINHSCLPNTSFGLGFEFRACRDVKAGEEITIAYCNVGMEKEKRRAYLLWNYGFECRCDRCQS